MVATPEQRERARISRKGIHWEEPNDDMSVPGLLAGRGKTDD